jgi:hypothetical protein
MPTALVSAAGGTKGTGTSWAGGDGGLGRIKILYGTSKNLPASGITPAPTVDLMPPLTITSTTHPDQNLYYNDAFQMVGVSWNRSFPSVQGYWYRVNTAASSVPAPDPQSIFTGSELLSIDPNAVSASTTDYFFHIISIDAMSVAGKVEQPYRFRVNKLPPVVSSMTHPSQTTWYASGGAVFYKWTNPSPASADGNYRGYHYIMDHYGDTLPSTTSTFLPITQKQINIANLEDVIWGFHIISEDTKGYLTKVAAHYVVRLGVNPGVANVSGQVLESSPTGPKPVTGVTITLNRQLLKSAGVNDLTTDAMGNFNFGGNIPVGTWEVQASKTGYVTAVQMVSVPSGGATVNVMLVKM